MMSQFIRSQAPAAAAPHANLMSLLKNPPEEQFKQIMDLMSWPKEVESLRIQLDEKMEKAMAKLRQLREEKDRRESKNKKSEDKHPVVKQEPQSGTSESYEWQYEDDGDPTSCLMLCSNCHDKVAVMECCPKAKYCSRRCFFHDRDRHEANHIGASLSDPIFPDGLPDEPPEVQVQEPEVARIHGSSRVEEIGSVTGNRTASAILTADEDEDVDVETVDSSPPSQTPVNPLVEPVAQELHYLDDSEDDDEPVIEAEPIRKTTPAAASSHPLHVMASPDDMDYEWQEKVKLEKKEVLPPVRVAGPRSWKIEKGIDDKVPVLPPIVDDEPDFVNLADDEDEVLELSEDSAVFDAADLI